MKETLIRKEGVCVYVYYVKFEIMEDLRRNHKKIR